MVRAIFTCLFTQGVIPHLKCTRISSAGTGYQSENVRATGI